MATKVKSCKLWYDHRDGFGTGELIRANTVQQHCQHGRTGVSKCHVCILSFIFKTFLWTYTNVFNNNFRANFSLKYNSSREENPVKFRIKSRKKLRTAQQLVLVFCSSEKPTVTIVFNFNLTVKQVIGSRKMREIEKHTRYSGMDGRWILLSLIPGSNPVVAVGLFSEGPSKTFCSCF